MKKEIKRLSIKNLSYDNFISEYLLSEVPIILENVIDYNLEKLTPEYIKNNFMDESKRRYAWFEDSLLDNDIIRIPSLVKKVLLRQDMSVRSLPMRIFMLPGGNITPSHFDGNSLNVFNLQIIGEKKWIITSPMTPLPTLPFSHVSLIGRNFVYDEGKFDYMEFNTKSGDLLFLPRYWSHEVHSICDINLHLSWVCTPTSPNKNSIIGNREIELLALKKKFKILDSISEFKLINYGGQGRTLVDKYTENVETSKVVKRLFKELSRLPKTLYLYKELKARGNELSAANFNI